MPIFYRSPWHHSRAGGRSADTKLLYPLCDLANSCRQQACL